jgi:uncharacterized protein YndB with AHSA1/START domain
MKTSVLVMNFSVDREKSKINVERQFAAPVEKVWSAWTDSKLLDQWWAPKPWQAKTKTMDFREGGHWLYAMIGPDKTEQWCRADYISIQQQKHFSGKDAFCDEQGKITEDFPRVLWNSRFTEKDGSTMVTIDLTFDSLTDLEKYIEMGFREGFTAALENLDELLNLQ